MSIKINQVNVKDLGPISTFSHDFNLVNLVFGHNELGKTSLVEFIIKSLFRNPKNWDLRDFHGKGKVVVSGLSDSMEEFQPESPRKIESFWEELHFNFPQDFSKLLVVRAAEVALTQSKNGIDSVILKKYLSGTELLDQIVGKIPKTIQEATIENKVVVGAQRGDIKNIGDYEKKYSSFVGLEAKISEKLSEGELLNLRNSEKEIDQVLSEMESAKRFRAYEINEQIEAIDEEITTYPLEELDDTANKMSNWHQLENLVNDEKKQLGEAIQKCTHLDWLKKAKEMYEARQGRAVPKNYFYFLIIGGLLVATSIFSHFYLRNLLVSISTFALGILSIGYYVYALNKIISKKNDLDDIQGIEKAYEEKFNQNFHGLVDLNTQIEQIKPFYDIQKILEDSIQNKKRQLDDLGNDINRKIKTFYQKKFSLNQVEKIIQETKIYIKTLEGKKNKYCEERAVLQVEQEYYIDTKPDIAWDLQKYEDLSAMRDDVRQKIYLIEGEFSDLKQSARDIAGTDMSDDWENIIWSIQQQIVDTERDLNNIRSKCIAQIIINCVVKDLQTSEDQKIQEGLRSNEIVDCITKITKRYTDIEYQNGIIYLKDKFGSYPLNEMSTGAIEQIFLSLRMGFASKLTEDNNLFLILDDAFQYSDWDRRPRLVDLVFELAKDDWQIIYFTMDDHIRDLFKQKAKHLPKSDFDFIEIK